MTVAEFDKLEVDEAAFVCRERMRCQYEGTVEHVMLGMQIKDAGRVFYTMPPSPEFDIKAELEIFDYEVEDDGMTEKKVVDSAAPKKKFDIPANASSIKSLMYKGGDAFDKFTSECRRAKISKETEHATVEDLEASGLLRILKACTSLEELHLKCTKFETFISPVLVSKMLSAAPHLAKSLKVLSIRLIPLEPDALTLIGGFKSLERLDISNSFSMELCVHSYNWYNDYDSMTAQSLPYDNQMMECIRSLKHLKRLDLGYGDDECKRYLFDYMLGSDVVSELSYGDFEFTMNKQAMPEEWSSLTRKKAARWHALVKVFEDETVDKDIHAMAEEELRTCPTCKKFAVKQCTRCKRQFYCSVICQKSDYKVHKKMCLECFD